MPSSNPYDESYQFPSWLVSGSVGGSSVYDTVIRTNVSSASAVRIAQAVANAAAAAAQGARAAAISNAARSVIEQAARIRAQAEWRNTTGSDAGYKSYEPSIFDKAASMLNPVNTAITTVSDSASAVAASALKSASGFGLGTLFGGAGAAVILGAGALILLVLLKK